jgi:hypothetical protein
MTLKSDDVQLIEAPIQVVDLTSDSGGEEETSATNQPSTSRKLNPGEVSSTKPQRYPQAYPYPTYFKPSTVVKYSQASGVVKVHQLKMPDQIKGKQFLSFAQINGFYNNQKPSLIPQPRYYYRQPAPPENSSSSSSSRPLVIIPAQKNQKITIVPSNVGKIRGVPQGKQKIPLLKNVLLKNSKNQIGGKSYNFTNVRIISDPRVPKAPPVVVAPPVITTFKLSPIKQSQDLKNVVAKERVLPQYAECVIDKRQYMDAAESEEDHEPKIKDIIFEGN